MIRTFQQYPSQSTQRPSLHLLPVVLPPDRHTTSNLLVYLQRRRPTTIRSFQQYPSQSTQRPSLHLLPVVLPPDRHTMSNLLAYLQHRRPLYLSEIFNPKPGPFLKLYLQSRTRTVVRHRRAPLPKMSHMFTTVDQLRGPDLLVWRRRQKNRVLPGSAL